MTELVDLKRAAQHLNHARLTVSGGAVPDPEVRHSILAALFRLEELIAEAEVARLVGTRSELDVIVDAAGRLAQTIVETRCAMAPNESNFDLRAEFKVLAEEFDELRTAVRHATTALIVPDSNEDPF